MTLFEKYGGLKTVTAIVDALYRGMLVSPVLKPYFEGIDMQRLMQAQVRFVSYVMGLSTSLYEMERLQCAHFPLKITDEAFDETADIFRQVLVSSNVEAADIEHLMGVIASVRANVVNP